MLILASAIALGLAPAASAQTTRLGADNPAFTLCRNNSMLDFFIADLPRDVERAGAATDLDADAISVSQRTRYLLEGDVVLRRADQRLAAQRMTYNSADGQFAAEGEVQYQDRSMLLGADRARGDQQTERTELDQVRYQLIGARGNGQAATAIQRGDARSDLTEVTFSTCDPGQRDWEIRAATMRLDHDTGEGRATDLRLRFKDVTLLRLPFASFPIDDRRRSGFLVPSFGGSNNGGFDFSIPYYLNLAPNFDATLIPRMITDRGFMLGAESRYLLPAHRGQWNVDWMPNDRTVGRSRYLWRGQQSSSLAPWLSFRADISGVSDPRYFEDLGDSLTAAATPFLYSAVYFDARGDNWFASLGGDDVEVTDPRLPRQIAPYRRLPRLVGGFDQALVGPLRFGFAGEWVDFDRPDSITGERLDLMPSLSAPIERAGWFVRPEIAWRNTRYELSNTDGPQRPSRSLPIASLDAGLIFERPLRLFERSLRQTLEPRVYYLRTPFRDQDALPIFDTQELSFSFAQLFRPTRFSGADRQNDANQATLALTTRLLDDASGGEVLRASIGQISYFEPQRVQLPGVPASDFSRSAWAGELALAVDRRWRLVLAQQYDPNIKQTLFSTVGVRGLFDGGGVVNVDYRFRRGRFEQIDTTAAWPVSENLRLVGRYNHSLDAGRTLEAFAGLEYRQCCYAVRALVRHYVRNTEGDTANAIFIELELNGLGALGRGTGDFLRQSIVGYR